MQTQDASAEIMFKFWPWFEANRKRLACVAVAVLAILFIWYYLTTQREQKEVAAGQALTKLQLSMSPGTTAQQMADACLKVAKDYAGTVAAQRAQLQAAETFYGAGRYADAQAAFQKVLASAIPGSPTAGARLGVAASLEAQGKLEAAVAEYRAVTTSYPDSNEAIAAKFAQGRILELQGKPNEAVSFYQEVARAPLAGTMASEAAQRAAQIQAKAPAVKPAAK
jgi:predicted negative regulator of RcsB-dependent stress response